MMRWQSGRRLLCGSSVTLVSLAACMGQTGGSPATTTTAMASSQTLQDQVLRGRGSVASSACGDCHGPGTGNPAAAGWLAGRMTPQQDFPVGPFMTRPRNLTPDSTTGIGRYSDRQIFNALRYGLRPSMTPDVEITSSTPGQGNHPAKPNYLAPTMPWVEWRHKPDAELRAIVAYLRHGLKPVTNKVEDSQAPPDFWASEYTVAKIGPYPATPFPTANEVTGQGDQAKVIRGRATLIKNGCGGCHGGGGNPASKDWLAGIKDTTGEFKIGPFKTRPRNLTPDNTTGTGRFTERQIFNALRFGLRPGETPDVEITSTIPGQGNFPAVPKYLAVPMPWPSWRHMSDDDLWAIAAYLKHGVKPVRNKVADSEGPPDFWASAYTVEKIGTYPAAPFPTANERPVNRSP
ncbi:MAG: c-type cytochrome [Gemmatimonadaceae bacterium]